MEEEYEAAGQPHLRLHAMSLYTNVVISKWIFYHKLKVNDSLDRYKACWVHRGFTQHLRVDYKVKTVTVRTILSLSPSIWIRWSTSWMSIMPSSTALWQRWCTIASLPASSTTLVLVWCVNLFDIWMYLSMRRGPITVALPSTWYPLASSKSRSDVYLFNLQHGDDILYLLLYVNDIMLMSSVIQCHPSTTLDRLPTTWARDKVECSPLFVGVIVECCPQCLFLH